MAYRDFKCPVKTANNELIATAVNHLSKEIEGTGGSIPTWYLLALDGAQARTTLSLHQRSGVSKHNVTLVEKDRRTAGKLRRLLPDSTVVHTTMQKFVNSQDFRTGGYNVVFLDWTCTAPGNDVEKSPQLALEDLLRRTDHRYVVLAQTFNMRGKNMREKEVQDTIDGGSAVVDDRAEPEWLRGTDNLYEEEKVFICKNLAERTMRCSYLPLWNLHFESMYRRPKSSSWMMFMCVALWKIPTAEVPREHWEVYNNNQVQVKDRYDWSPVVVVASHLPHCRTLSDQKLHISIWKYTTI
jgi:hypothetical protein